MEYLIIFFWGWIAWYLTGTDDFLKILNTFKDENVFVISHKGDVLVDKFDHTIKFEKIQNFSKIVES